MRPVRYNVAASLDGYIADSSGAYDWIPLDPAIDFGALFQRVELGPALPISRRFASRKLGQDYWYTLGVRTVVVVAWLARSRLCTHHIAWLRRRGSPATASGAPHSCPVQ